MPSSFHGSCVGSLMRRDLDRAVAAIDRVALDRDFAGEAAVHGIVAQQMGVGLDRSEIVDGDDFDIVAPGLDGGAQNVAADAAKSVDGYANRHTRAPALSELFSTKRASAASATLSGVMPKCA